MRRRISSYTLPQAEQDELKNTLISEQKLFLSNGLRNISIFTANIPGIGPIQKAQLAVRGIISAANINIEKIKTFNGFGPEKISSIQNWFTQTQTEILNNQPIALTDNQVTEIKTRYLTKNKNLAISERDSLITMDELTETNKDLQSRISELAELTFFSYVKQSIGVRVIASGLLAVFLIFTQFCVGIVGTVGSSSLPTAQNIVAQQTIDIQAIKTTTVQTIIADITQKAPTSTIAPVSTKTNTAEPKQTAIVLVLPSETLPVLPTLAKIAQTTSGVLHFHFVNVGQGDSTVIQAPDGQIMLIDGGDPNTGIVQYMQSLGVKRIDLMVATHPHADHISGLVQVLQAFPVTKVIYGGEIYTTKTPVPCYNNIRNEPEKQRCWQVRFCLSQGMVGFWDGLVIL